MSVRNALYALLAGDATLLGLVSGIYHQVAPESAETPFVCFWKQAGTPRWTFQGAPLEWDLWTVRVTALKSSETEAAFARVDELLNDAVIENGLLVLRESDLSFSEVDGGTIYRHLGGLYRIATQP